MSDTPVAGRGEEALVGVAVRLQFGIGDRTPTARVERVQRVVAGVAVGVVRPPGAGDTDEGVDGQEPLGGRVVGALPQPLETGHREPARGEARSAHT